MLKITQVKSAIRRKQDHKDTVRALGLKRLHHTVYHEDTDTVRGMVRKVGYLLEVTEVDAAEVEQAPADGGATVRPIVVEATEPAVEEPAATEAQPAEEPETEPEQVTDVAAEREADELPDEDMFPDQAEAAGAPGEAAAAESAPEAPAPDESAAEESAADEKTEE